MSDRTSGRLIRTRWAAVGAAVAVVLGGGGVSLVGAELGSGEKPVTVLLDEPCRLRDTRPNHGIGGRSIPIDEGEIYTVQGTGESGGCDVPTDAVGLVTNVTAVLPSAATDLRLYPTGGAVPGTSNLNPAPGQPPTPNAVTVGLSADGEFDILNKFGTVHVIIDVAAYLVDHHHDDRYYTEAEADGRFYTKSQSDNRYYTQAEADDTFLGVGQDSHAAIAGGDNSNFVGQDDEVLLTVTVDTPASGYVIVNASAHLFGFTSEFDNAQCSISETSSADPDVKQLVSAGDLAFTPISMTRGFVVNKAVLDPDEMTFNLVCSSLDDAPALAFLYDANLTAIFIPDPDAFKPLPPL